MPVTRSHNHEFKLMAFSPQGAAFAGDLRAWAQAKLEPGIAEWEAGRRCPLKGVLQSLARHVPAVRDLGTGGATARAEAALALEDALAPVVAMDIAAAISLQLNVVAPVLATFASSALRKDYLAGVLGGDLLVSWSMPDEDTARALPQAQYDEGRLVVTGRAVQALNAVDADLHAQVVRIVRAGAGETLGLVLIPADAAGIEVVPRELLGYRCAPLSDLHYRGTVVAADRLVGTAGTGGALAAQQRRAFMALSAVRLAATATYVLGRTKAWCKERKTFGTPLLANQSVQFRLAELSANAALTLRLARAAVEAPTAAGAASLPEKAKYAANQLAAEVAEFATHLHGSHGYVEGSDVARFYRDTAVAVKHAGANDALLRHIFEAEPAQSRSIHA
ncbi:MAG: acyl-CoA dehydrogenase family protein [Pseudomonadota bacterium]